ncbi:hypothetical protein BDR03DRAFT_951680 [Suillus americanus]|nr:hypothetical protein BDR03DRAFT_951680 [Suillus americanus]
MLTAKYFVNHNLRLITLISGELYNILTGGPIVFFEYFTASFHETLVTILTFTGEKKKEPCRVNVETESI